MEIGKKFNLGEVNFCVGFNDWGLVYIVLFTLKAK